MAVPRIIHQTWKTKRLPPQLARWAASWRAHNPDWEWRLYDDADCEAVLAESFPQLLPLYRALERPVERADLFRYAVLWRDGGVYADLDAVCLAPIDAWLRADDQLVVGVEAQPRAPRLGYVWPRQLCQWTIAAAPRHPCLQRAVETVAARVQQRGALEPQWRATAGGISARDWLTIMMTGPGAWTAAVEEGLRRGEPLRLLPECAFGMRGDTHARCRGEAVVAHQFLGSWKERPRKAVLLEVWLFVATAALLVAAFVMVAA